MATASDTYSTGPTHRALIRLGCLQWYGWRVQAECLRHLPWRKMARFRARGVHGHSLGWHHSLGLHAFRSFRLLQHPSLVSPHAAETYGNKLETQTVVAESLLWQMEMKHPVRTPQCGNIRKQVGNKGSCYGFPALANQHEVSVPGARFGNKLKQVLKQGLCHGFPALATSN